MTDLGALREMLQQIGLAPDTATLERLLWFRDEMLRWNRKINLTAITDPLEALEKHLVDSLTLVPHLRQGARLLDMGSGGGFPAIPLKIVRPDLEIVSVDAVAKKIAFQKHAARSLTLEGFSALHARLESLRLATDLPSFDYVVARAFADLKTIARLAAPLLTPGGQVVAMKGSDGLQELTEGEADLQAAGIACDRVLTLNLPRSKAKRTLLFLVKAGGDSTILPP